MQKGAKLLKENLITLTLRLPESIILDIDREIARRLYEAPGIILHRSDIARDLIVRSLRDQEQRRGGPPQAADRTADHAPMVQDQAAAEAAIPQDHLRTARQAPRKRHVAAKG